MPKRTDKDNEVTVNSSRKRIVNPKPRIAANGHKLPEKLPTGVVLTDVTKKQWVLGPSIGLGGFGEIYLASDICNKPVGPDSQYVIKIEHHQNGPLFSEMHFYHRVAKEENITAFVQKKKLDYLGMPRFVANGSHEHNGIKYRFMVMDRFGEDLQKILNRSNNVFPLKTVFVLGLRILDILEYIHSFGYIHADVKGSNLLLGHGRKNEVYLIDFGLACRFMANDKHKEFKEDLRKAHDGTIEFTSRDAHIGAHSRRGDMEILGYNMLQWLCGRLPWENNLKDPEYVSHQKSGYMMNLPLLMTKCFPSKVFPIAIQDFMQYIANLEFEEEPNYDHCRSIFKSALKEVKMKNMRIVFSEAKSKPTVKEGNQRSNSPAKKRTRTVVTLPSTHDNSDSEEVASQKRGRRKERVSSQDEESDETDLASKPGTSKVSKKKSQKKTASASENSGKEKSSSYSGDCDSILKLDSSLENPTPAMLQVMQRKLETQNEAKRKKKTFATFSAAGNTISDTFKEQVVLKYKQKSPDLFPVVKSDIPTKPKRLGRSQLAKESIDRRPLATRPTQEPAHQFYRENSYSPEV